mgnify:CR=1 FL=1
MSFSTVLVTFPDLGTAHSICRTLIERRLAACANLLDSKSIYSWRGDIEEAAEVVALLKTRTEDFEAIREFIISEHPYEVPCIVRYDIAKGERSYLDLIRESTERPQED